MEGAWGDSAETTCCVKQEFAQVLVTLTRFAHNAQLTDSQSYDTLQAVAQQAGRHADRHARRQARRQAGKQTGRQAGRQAGTQARRQARRQAGN